MSRESKQSRVSCEETEYLNTEQQLTEFLSDLDLPNNPSKFFNLTEQNPAYVFYSCQSDEFTCLAAIEKLHSDGNKSITDETLFYLKVIPAIAKHLDIIDEVDYQKLNSLYQRMFETLSELRCSSSLVVNYNLVNSQIGKLQTVGLDIPTITSSVQERSLER
ncbi:hypothetical protein OAP83_02070 [Rickettsiales bacterium]|nr:hypothetical protein [Rickettsiales bacterium]